MSDRIAFFYRLSVTAVLRKFKIGPLLTDYINKLGLLLGIVVFTSSCAVNLSAEKRRYRPGYHIEASTAKRKPDPIGHRAMVPPIEQESPTGTTVPEQFEPIALAGPSTVEVITAMPNGTTDERIGKPVAMVPMAEREDAPHGRSPVVGQTREEPLVQGRTTRRTANDAGGMVAMRVMGIVLSVLGFLIALFVSWLIGLIIMLVGLAFWIASSSGGRSSGGTSGAAPRSRDPEWQDVVYLKNGSVIRGIVIEQVPNVSLKIKTADGSVFVFEMDQVVKIAKEQK